MPIYIQTGGAGAQLGGGLGAGFSKGVTDAMEQQRREQTAQMEASLREEAAVADQGRALERIKLGADLDAEAREDRQQFEVGQQAMADAAAEQKRLTALDGSRNVALTRLNRQLEGLGEGDGGADPLLARRRGITERAIAGAQGASTIAELSGFMVDHDAALGEIEISEGMAEANTLLEVLEAPGGDGAPTGKLSDITDLRAAIGSEDPMLAAEVVGRIIRGQEEEVKQQTSNALAFDRAVQSLAIWKEQPAPRAIRTEEEAREYAAWKAQVESAYAAALGTAQIAAQVQGLGFQPMNALVGLEQILDSVDPVTTRKVLAAEEARRVEAARAEAEAEQSQRFIYSDTAGGTVSSRSRDVERADPNRPMSSVEAALEADRLLSEGNEIGAVRMLQRAKQIKAQEGEGSQE